MRRSDMEMDCIGVFGKKGSVMIIEMDNKFRGNAYIIKSDEVLLNYSGGYADMANEIPNTLNTRFATASMGKTFVAVGILQLIEAGKLRFKDTLGAILDIDLKSIDPGVTVKQLLNHTSGVPDVSHLNIAKTKRKCGIIERENYNLPKSEDSRSPKTPKEKEEAIIEAFRHFRMI